MSDNDMSFTEKRNVMIEARDLLIEMLRAEVAKRDEMIGKYDNAHVMLRAEIKAIPVDAIRAMMEEWAAHGMRMTDSTTAVIEWLGSLGGDA